MKSALLAAALLALAGPALAGDPSEAQVDAAQQRMVACLQRLPTPQDGPWSAVQLVVRRYAAACDSEMLAFFNTPGFPDQSPFMEQIAFNALGCHIADADLDELQRIPEDRRTMTCVDERFVPSKAKWWAVIYDSGRVYSVSGPYDGIGQCAHSDEAQAHASAARCELSAVRPQ
jgi:hypothetical protein